MKTCTKCGTEQPLTEFYQRKPKSPSGRAGHLERCKSCLKESARKAYHADRAAAKARHDEWKARNPTGHRRSYYRKLYGITPEQRDEQIEAQGGQCVLCDVRLDSIPDRHVHVDHDHATGKTRGILCHWCNTQMGTLEKSPEWIARAIAYIARGGDWKCEQGYAALKAVA